MELLSKAADQQGSTKGTRTRILVRIEPSETIRKRLQMSLVEFSRALGLSEGTYAGWVRDGKMLQTAALAAEALMRRQQASGEEQDVVYILRVIKGAPLALRADELRRMTLDDVEYLLVPAKN